MKQIFFLAAFFFCFAAQAQDFSAGYVKNLLTNGSSRSWKAQKVLKLRQDITASLQACEMDNLFILKSDGTFEVREGASKCSASAPELIMSGTWTYDESLHYVNFTAGEEKFTWGLNVLTAEKISIYKTHPDDNSLDRAYELVY